MIGVKDENPVHRALDDRIAGFDEEFMRMARDDEAVRRLTKIPGIGTINATALIGNQTGLGFLDAAATAGRTSVGGV